MTGGEILVLMFCSSYLGICRLRVNSVGYGFELLIGVVQALIFAGLTLVFATMAAETHEG